MKNAFGFEVPEIGEIMQDATVKETIHAMLLDVLAYLGIAQDRAIQIVSRCLQAAVSCQLESYEEQAHQILEAEQVTRRVPEKLSDRASLMYGELSKYLLEGSVLDYGCGDGKVGEYIAKNRYTVSLADVYMHSHIKDTGLNFCQFVQGQTTAFADNSFDNTLALTVFHHCSNPLSSIRDVVRVTRAGGRVIVIESVYGVDGEELPAAMREKIAGYLALFAEQQRRVNVFFDHFYNRVLHYSKDADSKVNVPFNFNTPANWAKLFAEAGLVQETVVHLGLDQPTAPEYHTLHILRKS
jgi:2-polyprenyl-3-methyl-5-hydroxy-6-metoxy-1,4-benzoquinol methylase